jgi:exodeoxyribonuclease-5
MINSYLVQQIKGNFLYKPTLEQEKAVKFLADFLFSRQSDSVFLLKGYAGTGKTSLIGALVKTLDQLQQKCVLLAPTGRAAKVFSHYAQHPAYTIHKKIYRQRNFSNDLDNFSLDDNLHQHTLFIVDEASMLANYSLDASAFGSGNLLDDLVSYVRQGSRCRLIFVGDSAQLPPVGLDCSPALDPEKMRAYGDVLYVPLDEVMRQQDSSGILFNATLVRCMLSADIIDIPMFDLSFDDVEHVEGGEILERIQDAYDKYGMEETLIITRSNKRANRFNEGVRRNVLYAEEEIGSGDMLMVVKNNYYYTEREKDCKVDFIANGDTAQLVRIRHFHDFYGFRFADALLRFPDYDELELEGKILLDTLSSDSPSLTREQSSQLFYNVAEDYADITSKAKRYKEVRENPYFNAMQIKFAYAVTCHKAQGGQWKCVFVDKMLFGEEEMTRDLLQWLYTAITRATEKLYFINFDERFFDEK